MYFGLSGNGLSLYDITRFSGGKLSHVSCESVTASGISLDTRTLKAGEVFVALSGENFDGYDYISEAKRIGACCVITDRIPDADIPYILVKDTKTALGELARAYKRLFNSVSVAVTGSVGKTTTKEFIYSVLSKKYRTHKSEGNFNNEIGLPLTLISMDERDQLLVTEMGMNLRGEISYLSKIAEPDISVITNIGSAHIENLGTRENIRDAKLEIIDGMKPGGILILNGDDALLGDVLCENICRVYVGIDNPGADYRAVNIREGVSDIVFDVFDREEAVLRDAKINTIGRHNIYNALISCVIGILLGISDEDIKSGLLDFTPVDMRQTIRDMDGYTVIEDCYNANPESMKAAFDVLKHVADINKSRKIAVLGEMRELGCLSSELHREVGRTAADIGLDKLIVFGRPAEYIALGAHSSMSDDDIIIIDDTDDIEKAAEVVRGNLKKGDTVLFKASRAIALERVVSLI